VSSATRRKRGETAINEMGERETAKVDRAGVQIQAIQGSGEEAHRNEERNRERER